MAKYRVTEAQLQKIFEELEMKRLSEMDNYPPGSDTPDAPWNRKDTHKEGEYVSGDYVPVDFDGSEYLLKNKQTNQLYYTISDVWEDVDGDKDIKDVLIDYLDVEQEEYEDEDGRYMGTASDWRDYITNENILTALSSYMNFITGNKNNSGLDVVDDVAEWFRGKGKFLLVTPKTIKEIHSEKLKGIASKALGLG